MKERVLKDDEVMGHSDILHFDIGATEKNHAFVGYTVKSVKKQYRKHDLQKRKLIKVTRPGGKKMKEKKDYPAKFYAQRCMENADPTDLYISVDPNDLDMDHPMLEITYSKKKGFKIRQVMVKEKRTFVTKEVK